MTNREDAVPPARGELGSAARSFGAFVAILVAVACSDDGSTSATRTAVGPPRTRIHAIDDALSLAAASPAEALEQGRGFRVVPRAARTGDRTTELQRTAGPQWVMAPPLREAELPALSDGDVRLSASGGISIPIRRVDALSSPGRLSRGVVEYEGAVDGLDAMVFATERGVEDLWTIHKPRSRWGYEVELPRAWRVHIPPGVDGLAEVRDDHNVARLRMWARAAWDATGTVLPIAVSAEAHRVWLSLPESAVYPVIVDPEWTSTDTMVFPRESPTLTPLANGRVLVTGGESIAPGAAELFDPATSAFTISGVPTHHRVGGHAFRMGASAVLLVGGDSINEGLVRECEWYDVETGAFKPGPTVLNRRRKEASVQLPDGRVLVAGGSDDWAGRLTTGELFDAAETFWPTGKLVERQNLSSAVVLPTGEVLLSGGDRPGLQASASSELFDPKGSVFAPGPSLLHPRMGHQSLLRPSGKVLLVGGYGPDSVHLPELELLDPEMGETTGATEMITPRTVGLSTVALADGSVLIIGGDTWSGEALAETELHHPEDRAVRPGPRLHFARRNQNAALLPNGSVLVAGSSTLLAAPTAEVLQPAAFTPGATHYLQWPRVRHTATRLLSGEVLIAGSSEMPSLDSFDSDSGAFHLAGQLVGVHSRHTATLLPSGKVLFTGGLGAKQSVELYDPETKTSIAWVALNHGRSQHAATRLDEDRVLITGGCTSTEAEIVNISSRTVTTAPGSLLAKRYGHVASLLLDGRVLLAGGASNSAEIYDPSTGQSSAVPMNASRAEPTMVELPSSVLLLGGQVPTNTIEEFDQATETWTLKNATLPAHRGMSATLLHSGKVLITGGEQSTHEISNQAALYDPDTDTLTALNSTMTTPRVGHTATLLEDNRVLITGGSKDFDHYVADEGIATAEIYDPASDTFSPVDNTQPVMAGQTATLLPTGHVLFTGGHRGSRKAQLWDPISTSETGNLRGRRTGHTATVLRDGTLFIAGGVDWDLTLNTTEFYNETRGTFLDGPSLKHARRDHTSTLLPSGQVLLAGGTESREVELYDPATGQMRSAGYMLQKRYNHGASVLASGWVLLAGGTDRENAPIKGAELYDPETSTFHEVAWNTGVGGATRTGIDRAGNAFLAGSGAGIVLSEALEFVAPLSGLPLNPTSTFPLLWGGLGICGDSGELASTSCHAASARGLDSEPLLSVRGTNGTTTRLASGDVLVRSTGDVSVSIVFSAVPKGAIRPTVHNAPPSLRIGEEGSLTGKRFTSPPMKGAESLGPSADILPWVVFVPNAGGPSVLFPVEEWTDTTIRFEAAATTFHGPGWLHILVQGVPSEGHYMVLEPKLDGSACNIDGECEHGSCEEGVCCNTRCDSPCLSCLAANNGNDKDGQCLPVTEGADPKDACTESTCGLTGVCDDQGQCATYPELSTCAADKICRTGVCETTLGKACDSTVECAEGQACGENRTCVPWKPSPVVVDGGCNLGGPPRENRAWIALLAIALAATRRKKQRPA